MIKKESLRIIFIGSSLLLISSIISCNGSSTQNDLEIENETLRQEIAIMLTSKLETAEKGLTKLKSDIGIANDRNDILGSEKNALEIDNSLLKDNIARLQDNYDILKTDYDIVVNENDALLIRYDSLAAELDETEEASEPKVIAIRPSEPINEPPEKVLEIPDIAYITALMMNYTDDADPESDGISVRVAFYDDESKRLNLGDLQLVVNIKLWDFTDYSSPSPGYNAIIYEDEITIAGSFFNSLSLSGPIRIPFEELSKLENIIASNAPYDVYATIGVQITVSTPTQDDLEAVYSRPIQFKSKND